MMAPPIEAPNKLKMPVAGMQGPVQREAGLPTWIKARAGPGKSSHGPGPAGSGISPGP